MMAIYMALRAFRKAWFRGASLTAALRRARIAYWLERVREADRRSHADD